MAQNYIPLKRYEGYVKAIGTNTFIARLESTTESPLETEIKLEAIPQHEREYVKPGAFFYWTIGYRLGTDPQEPISVIEFNKTPITQKDIDRAKAQAQQLSERLGL